MSVNSIPNANILVGLSKPGGNSAQTTGASLTPGNSYSELALRIAGFQAQALGTLMNSAFVSNQTNASSDLNSLLASLNSSAAPLTGSSTLNSVGGLTATGRNSALFAPEPAYQMMSFINRQEVAYKAQSAELGKMQSALTEMQQNAQSLGSVNGSSDNESIKSQLQQFVGQYNDWITRFDADMQSGGTLADTQAAQVSRHELEQSIENTFNGARSGLRGLRDLGFSIDPVSKLATLDSTQLDSVLASNKAGAVSTVQEFSANFAKSAELLNSTGNFIQNRLNNLNGAVHFIADNLPKLQAEFGLGDSASPASSQVTQAAAAYKLIYGI